jgi:nucleotide-binding universal stress UspA family protein
MPKIMLATDFSERSDRALRRAILMAKEIDAGLVLLHVVDDDRPRRIVERDRVDAEALLQELAATVRSVDGVACEARVMLADPFAGILQAVAEGEPDLLVIGSHRRRLLRDVFVGTTAERTIRAVTTPVLMVNAPPVGPYRHILLTTDLSEGSRETLQVMGRLKFGAHAARTVLHVYAAPALRLAMAHSLSNEDQEDYLHHERAAALQSLAELMAACGAGDAAAIARHDGTTVANEILTAAAELKADLVVVSTHAKTSLARMFLGSVTEQVLRTSPLDVLAVPPELARR